MRNKVVKIVSGLLQSLRTGRQYVNISFLGRDLRVLKGTVRTNVDKDDAWFACLAKETKILFDIGANVGYTALLANLYGKPDQIVLLDANVDALGVGFRNLAMNNMSLNCLFYRAFVSSKDTEQVKFYTVGTGAAGSMYKSHAKTASAVDSYFYVETITLDSLCARLNLVPDLVKIDVEGAEALVLEGGESLGKKLSTTFFVEMHSTTELPMVENAKRVLEWCNRIGYKAYYLKDHALLEDPGAIRHRGKCHLMLLPAGKTYPDRLKTISEGEPLPNIDNVSELPKQIL